MKKRPALVTQHMENISRDALEKHQDIVRHYVRDRQGIYALYRKGKLQYVGLASNLRSRLAHHLKDRHRDSWDRFSVYLTIGESHLRELEALILRIVKVPGNKQKGKFSKSEDIRRRFGREIRAKMRIELDELLGKRALAVERPTAARRSEGREPILAKYVSAPMTIRARYKGRLIRARVRRDGSIRFDGRVFTSPSLAGIHAIKRRSCNGWTFWQYERSPGDWVALDLLRK